MARPLAPEPPTRADDPAESREARLHFAGGVGAAVMERGHLDILDVAAAVRALVLDAEIRELHAIIGHREFVIARPLPNLFARSRSAGRRCRIGRDSAPGETVGSRA